MDCPPCLIRLASRVQPLPEVFTLGHSPDPDDAFMFYAMAEQKIDLRGYRFDHRLEDIQTLNERAMRGELHISALSIHAYAFVSDRYALLSCGASMGDGYGPLVVAQRGHPVSLAKCRIAVPGEMTSAYLALRLFLGHDFAHIVVPFDKIFEAVKSGRAEAGLIIHEGQLTYEQAGFEKVVDLGEWWKGETGLPLPLGGNVIRRDIPTNVQREIGGIIRESIDYGLQHREPAIRHSLPYARDMAAPLTDRFIGMYVNDYTRDYGTTGQDAIRRFLGEAHERGFLPAPPAVEFVR